MPLSSRHFLLLILTAYLLLTLAYGVVNPLFEAPDEHHHFFTVLEVAESRRLPFVGEEPDGLIGQEAAQPPLYYIVTAALITPLETAGAREAVWFNPRVQLGDASSPTNTNAFVHLPAEAWPWRGYVLAAQLLRAFSTLVGLGTLLAIYGSARLIWPALPRRALLATAIAAFLPQFNFLHASISNDPFIIFLSSAALWQLLRLWFTGLSRRRLLLLGITIGLAILSKMAGLVLLIYALGFLTALMLREAGDEPLTGQIRPWLVNGALIAAPALLIGGWLLVRNWLLYEDITATSQFIRIAGGDRDFTLGQVLGESSGLWLSLFAVFGWMNVRPPEGIFLLWNGLVLAAAGGALLPLFRAYWPGARGTVRRSPPAAEGPLTGWGRSPTAPPDAHFAGSTVQPIFALVQNWLRQRWAPAVLLGGWLLAVYAGLVQFMLKTPAAQGRLLFPALVPLALAFAYGLSRYRQRRLEVAVSLLALSSSLYCLIFVIPPAYALPERISPAEIPAQAALLDADMGQGLRVVAVEVEPGPYRPGDWIWLTLYWQAETPPAPADLPATPEYVVELLGRENELVGKLQSYHGGGLYPASQWVAGEVVVDRLAVRLEEGLETPSRVRLNLKLVGGGVMEGTPVVLSPAAVDVGAVKVTPAVWPVEAGETAVAEWEGIRLLAAALGQETAVAGDVVPVRLRWQVTAPPGLALTTFVHLGDPGQTPLVQGDGPPLGGDYPTDLWVAGELFDDQYALTIPVGLESGRYPVQVGLYDPQSGQRRPLFIDGQRQPHDAYVVGWLEIRAQPPDK